MGTNISGFCPENDRDDCDYYDEDEDELDDEFDNDEFGDNCCEDCDEW